MDRVRRTTCASAAGIIILLGARAGVSPSTASSTHTRIPISGSQSPEALPPASTQPLSAPTLPPQALPAPAASADSLSTPSPPPPSPQALRVLTGSSVDTRWGPVQVRVTFQGARITSIDVPVYPDGNGRDAEINSRALPALIQETLSAQSAHIDAVSGATYTSDGYISSLQSALDRL